MAENGRLHPSSFILHPSSFILPRSSFRLHPSYPWQTLADFVTEWQTLAEFDSALRPPCAEQPCAISGRAPCRLSLRERTSFRGAKGDNDQCPVMAHHGQLET